MNFRSRPLLDLAHHLPCQWCGAGVASEPAHSNLQRHGKGMSIKAHDCYFAALCHDCHSALDQGSRLSKQERMDMWQTAFERTLLELWRRNWLTVKR